MVELYWAEAWELDPPSEGVGYGDLEASMAITDTGCPVCVAVKVEGVRHGSASIWVGRLALCSYTHAGMLVGCQMGRWVDDAGWPAGAVRVAADVERRRVAVVDVVRDGVDVQRTAC